ncbi:ABC transporter ATP-binding protein [Bradyrhizobium septentrionale]|uniref:ABC transporter ATP-binding protein n=1 Tax=Bradyrhizobium septentrionale TaxID=1404411 RepID=A0A973VZX0_9BRAD|nr:ABC transporter ATP-binding protein [Bradyrhizobium septentrionale]UGY13444.1 ABC transporter ATP-binding protein [Bradyrhizobium septentrionale]UGY22085.1 ABC transporter ATP-binding protein [Bradyrhizobium septentrionale]
MPAAPVVSIKNLKLALPPGSDRPYAVDGVSFDLTPGKILCVVGESGSGKSMCAHALLGLLPDTIAREAGEIAYDGRNLLTLDDTGWLALRGRHIAMVFQEPMTALNPLMRIGEQIAEMFEAHNLLTPKQRKQKALQLLREVGLPDPERSMRAYPHQLSGGQRQRAMIAMALALEPAVLVADEPTTALDVTTQAQILELIRDLQRRRNMAVMFITHDFGVVADIADRVVVLQHGKVVEQGAADDVLQRPQHSYTRALLAAVPSMQPPQRAPLTGRARAVEIVGLDKTYVSGGGWFQPERRVAAARQVNFDILQGETVGLVGESGSGKSSVARLVMRLIEPDRGTVRLGETDFTRIAGRALRRERSRIQMIFQDPFASLNPRRKVGHIIADGPIAHGTDPAVARQRAAELLGLVGLNANAMDRYPHEFSGGQRQRIGIARALALEPEIIVADEAVSALDVSVQAQVLNLLEDLKARLGLSMLFITHDLRVAAQICDRIAVMQRGAIVELKPTATLFSAPEHAYTRELLAAVPGQIPSSRAA